jgi:hypothetical protein
MDTDPITDPFRTRPKFEEKITFHFFQKYFNLIIKITKSTILNIKQYDSDKKLWIGMRTTAS